MNGMHGTQRPVTVPIVENDLRHEFADVAAEIGRPRPVFEVVDEPVVGVVAADNGDDTADGRPWVQVRPKLAAAPDTVRRWAFCWALAMSTLPTRPGWVRTLQRAVRGLDAVFVVTGMYTLLGIAAALLGLPVAWLAWTGAGICTGAMALQVAGVAVLARHERRRVYTADRAAAGHGYPIPAQAGTWLHEPTRSGPFASTPGIRARRRRLSLTTPTRAKGDQA